MDVPAFNASATDTKKKVAAAKALVKLLSTYSMVLFVPIDSVPSTSIQKWRLTLRQPLGPDQSLLGELFIGTGKATAFLQGEIEAAEGTWSDKQQLRKDPAPRQLPGAWGSPDVLLDWLRRMTAGSKQGALLFSNSDVEFLYDVLVRPSLFSGLMEPPVPIKGEAEQLSWLWQRTKNCKSKYLAEQEPQKIAAPSFGHHQSQIRPGQRINFDVVFPVNYNTGAEPSNTAGFAVRNLATKILRAQINICGTARGSRMLFKKGHVVTEDDANFSRKVGLRIPAAPLTFTSGLISHAAEAAELKPIDIAYWSCATKGECEQLGLFSPKHEERSEGSSAPPDATLLVQDTNIEDDIAAAFKHLDLLALGLGGEPKADGGSEPSEQAAGSSVLSNFHSPMFSEGIRILTPGLFQQLLSEATTNVASLHVGLQRDHATHFTSHVEDDTRRKKNHQLTCLAGFDTKDLDFEDGGEKVTVVVNGPNTSMLNKTLLALRKAWVAKKVAIERERLRLAALVPSRSTSFTSSSSMGFGLFDTTSSDEE